MLGGNSTYTRFASLALEHSLKTGEIYSDQTSLNSDLYRQRGCFLSIFDMPGRRLRLQTGHVLPLYPNLGFELASHALTLVNTPSARRFVRSDLKRISLSVTIIGPLQRIQSVVGGNPAIDGLYLKTDKNRSALILPGRSGLDSPEDQLATAIRESGANPHAESLTLYRFNIEDYAD
jgi:AMMECR1 domain-containing protein